MAEVRKSITALYRDFEAAHSALQDVPETEGNVAVCRKIAAGIVKLPADNIDEMILKIRIALRCVGALLSFFFMIRSQPRSTRFPYTTLFRIPRGKICS